MNLAKEMSRGMLVAIELGRTNVHNKEIWKEWTATLIYTRQHIPFTLFKDLEKVEWQRWIALYIIFCYWLFSLFITCGIFGKKWDILVWRMNKFENNE